MTNFDVLKLQDDISSSFRLKAEWNEESFKITVFLTSLKAYYGHVTEEYLKTLAAKREQNVSDYYQNLKEHVMSPGPDILFNIKQPQDSNCDNVEFLIKRTIGGRTILYFSTPLCEVNFIENVFNMIDNLYENTQSLSQEVVGIKQKQIQVEEEKQTCQEKLAEFIELKSNWEQEMYSNFLIVLNEKKKHIKFLTDLLKRKNINPNDLLNEENAYAAVEETPVLPKKLETISDSGSEYDTDKEDGNSNYDEDIEMEPTPSTSKQNIQMEEDPPPLLRLPKLSKKPKEKESPKKIKQSEDLTSKILNTNTESTQDTGTQEPYLSTQEMLDRY